MEDEKCLNLKKKIFINYHLEIFIYRVKIKRSRLVIGIRSLKNLLSSTIDYNAINPAIRRSERNCRNLKPFSQPQCKWGFRRIRINKRTSRIDNLHGFKNFFITILSNFPIIRFSWSSISIYKSFTFLK